MLKSSTLSNGDTERIMVLTPWYFNPFGLSAALKAWLFLVLEADGVMMIEHGCILLSHEVLHQFQSNTNHTVAKFRTKIKNMETRSK